MKNKEPEIHDLSHRLKELEDLVTKMNFIVEELAHSIPSNRKKAFPKDGEDPFYRVGPFLPVSPDIHDLSNFSKNYCNPSKIFIPKHEKSFNGAKKRMQDINKNLTSFSKKAKEWRKLHGAPEPKRKKKAKEN